MKKRLLLYSLVFVIIACKTSKKIELQEQNQIPANLLGSFKDDYGSNYTITNREWKQGKKTKYQLLQFNKEDNFFIARNDSANISDGGLYTRIDIVYFNDMEPWLWGYCLTAYKASTIKEALHTAAADRTNPRKGCNGFPFSRMKRE